MYQNQSKYELKNINIKINSKEHWSVVGLNGAGKTTFIKLLCRLYECTDGEILVNGVNILEYDYASYCKIIAIILGAIQYILLLIYLVHSHLYLLISYSYHAPSPLPLHGGYTPIFRDCLYWGQEQMNI